MDNWETSSEPVKFDSLNGTWSFTDNAMLNKIWTALVRMMRWVIIKNALYLVFVACLALAFGYSTKDKKLADELATHATNDNPVGMFDAFIKNKKAKIKFTNSHPIYDSEIVKEWEVEYSQDFAKLFQYITIINTSGEKEDLLVMRKAAIPMGEEVAEKLELSTTISDDAENICEEYFAEVPNNYQKNFFDKKRHIRIRNIKDELTQENDEGEKFFRCVITQETINDLLDE